MKYTIKKQFEGEGQNEFDSIIEISGLTSETSVNGLLDYLESVKKTVKQQEGQVQMNEVFIEKAVEALPMLKDIPEDKLGLVLSFVSKFMANKESVEILKTCAATIETYEKHLDSIEKETGIKCVPIISPIQNG